MDGDRFDILAKTFGARSTPTGYQSRGSPSPICNNNPNCGCDETAEGEVRCWDVTAGTGQCGLCTSDADCASFAPGSFCKTCCGTPETYSCAFPCPS